jgi:hypothetical protein
MVQKVHTLLSFNLTPMVETKKPHKMFPFHEALQVLYNSVYLQKYVTKHPPKINPNAHAANTTHCNVEIDNDAGASAVSSFEITVITVFK